MTKEKYLEFLKTVCITSFDDQKKSPEVHEKFSIEAAEKAELIDMTELEHAIFNAMNYYNKMIITAKNYSDLNGEHFEILQDFWRKVVAILEEIGATK